MKKIAAATILSLFFAAAAFPADRPSHSHEVYFEGSNFELHIFRINGRTDGNTMLIIGGIQGDEPGGFLSADLYSDLALEKGNLIVVPRANLKSIILFNRGPDGDMNRLFTDENPTDIQGEVVYKLKKLMGEADIVLNLHDGWGFHSPTYVDKSRNPNRFGQSIIIDEAVFSCDDNKTLPLKEMASAALEKVNEKIEDPDLRLHLFNTETGNPKSRFKDMKKTATWYALNTYCIPAFGIEGSKNVKSLEQNVLHHNYAVNEFMKIMDIIPEQPRVMVIKPEMETAVIKVNNFSMQLRSGDTLKINPGDVVEVTGVESNYTRGITCDILGYGTLNDLNKPFEIKGDTKIVFRKDNQKMSEITVRVNRSASAKNTVNMLLMKINGHYRAAVDGETVSVSGGDVLEIIKAFGDGTKDLKVPVNFKGWVPDTLNNNGDDRNYKISVDPESMMKKYAVKGKGNVYPIIAGNDKNPVLTIYLEIK